MSPEMFNAEESSLPLCGMAIFSFLVFMLYWVLLRRIRNRRIANYSYFLLLIFISFFFGFYLIIPFNQQIIVFIALLGITFFFIVAAIIWQIRTAKIKRLRREYEKQKQTLAEQRQAVITEFDKKLSELNKRRVAILDELKIISREQEILATENLQKLTPSEFEKYVALIFQKKGYRTKLCGGTNDQGIDIEAWHGDEYVIIQCKRYSQTVPSSAVREFGGVLLHKNPTKGYFVTTGRFTKDGYEYAKGKPLELVGPNKLIHWLKELKIGSYDSNLRQVQEKKLQELDQQIEKTTQDKENLLQKLEIEGKIFHIERGPANNSL